MAAYSVMAMVKDVHEAQGSPRMVQLELNDRELWDKWGDDHYVETERPLKPGDEVRVYLPSEPGQNVTLA